MVMHLLIHNRLVVDIPIPMTDNLLKAEGTEHRPSKQAADETGRFQMSESKKFNVVIENGIEYAEYVTEDGKAKKTKILPPSDHDIEWASSLGLSVAFDGIQGVTVTNAEGERVYPRRCDNSTTATRHGLVAALGGYAAGRADHSEDGYTGRPKAPSTSKLAVANARAEAAEAKAAKAADLMAAVAAGEMTLDEATKALSA